MALWDGLRSLPAGQETPWNGIAWPRSTGPSPQQQQHAGPPVPWPPTALLSAGPRSVSTRRRGSRPRVGVSSSSPASVPKAPSALDSKPTSFFLFLLLRFSFGPRMEEVVASGGCARRRGGSGSHSLGSGVSSPGRSASRMPVFASRPRPSRWPERCEDSVLPDARRGRSAALPPAQANPAPAAGSVGEIVHGPWKSPSVT